jgi:hypothetical protein
MLGAGFFAAERLGNCDMNSRFVDNPKGDEQVSAAVRNGANNVTRECDITYVPC